MWHRVFYLLHQGGLCTNIYLKGLEKLPVLCLNCLLPGCCYIHGLCPTSGMGTHAHGDAAPSLPARVLP